MTQWVCIRTDELQHHGIKGQKWGVRRFQNKDGSLTPAGRRRYDDSGREKAENHEKVEVGGQTFKVYGNRKENKKYAQQKREQIANLDTKISKKEENKVSKKEKNVSKYEIPENKSLHRLKLEDKYKKQGLSQEQAEQKAAKRIRAEKFVAAAAVITVAGCIAYNKHKGYTKDIIFKEGSEFQRIMKLAENAEIKEGRQYLAFDKNDKIKYRGMLAKTLSDKSGMNERIYDVTVKNTKEIKVASEKAARDTFYKLYRDNAEFKNSLDDTIKDYGFLYTKSFGLQNINAKVNNDKKLSDKQVKRDLYDLFNIMMGDRGTLKEKDTNTFYDAILKNGYNALQDINDKKYSGYKSKMPIITIGDGFEYSKRVMEAEEIVNTNKKALVKTFGPEVLKVGAFYTAGRLAGPIIDNVQVNKRVAEYKLKHPDTKMTDSEIKSMVKEQIQKDIEALRKEFDDMD